MQRKFSFAEGEYYHLYNRGVEKRSIFTSTTDRERFVRLLFLSNGRKRFIYREVERLSFAEIDRGNNLTAVGAYVLMPNHFHILAKEITPGGISRFMEKLLTGYSLYFNKKHLRVGPLFQGTFKAQHVTNDEHLKYLFSYIHLNPIKIIQKDWKEIGIADTKKAKTFLSQYMYSSYPIFLGAGDQNELILNREEFPEYFAREGSCEQYIDDWLETKKIYLGT